MCQWFPLGFSYCSLTFAKLLTRKPDVNSCFSLFTYYLKLNDIAVYHSDFDRCQKSLCTGGGLVLPVQQCMQYHLIPPCKTQVWQLQLWCSPVFCNSRFTPSGARRKEVACKVLICDSRFSLRLAMVYVFLPKCCTLFGIADIRAVLQMVWM